MPSNERILAIKRDDPENVGDVSCSPMDYFSFPVPYVRDDILRAHLHSPDDKTLLILGGGGLLYYREMVMDLMRAWPHVALWGLGLNTHGKTEDAYPALDPRLLVGVRDLYPGMPWVPCVSCMSGLFDAPYTPEHEAVVFSHKDAPLPADRRPHLTNRTSMREAVEFLASGRRVLTNSYHGAYWASLLGRQVDVVRPFSSKFHYTFFGRQRLQQTPALRGPGEERVSSAPASPHAPFRTSRNEIRSGKARARHRQPLPTRIRTSGRRSPKQVRESWKFPRRMEIGLELNLSVVDCISQRIAT